MMHKKASHGKAKAGKAKPAVKAVKSAAKKPAPARKTHHGVDVEQKAWDSLAALRKAFLIGLGATVMTAEKLRDAVKELVDDMVARGDLKPAEAKKVADDLRRRFLEGKIHMEDGIRHALDSSCRKTLETLGKATRSLEVALSVPVAPKKAVVKELAKKPAAKKPAAKKPAKKTLAPASKTKAAPRQAAMKASKGVSAAAPKKAPAKGKKTASAKKAR